MKTNRRWKRIEKKAQKVEKELRTLLARVYDTGDYSLGHKKSLQDAIQAMENFSS